MDEVSDIAPYSSIMLAVGSGKQKYSSISDALGKPTAAFMAFYYRFIEPNKSMIALGRGNIAKKFINEGFNGHVAEVW